MGEPQIIGRYAIYGKIASGGMASVHFGRLLGGAGFSRTVAIKRLHAHLIEDPDFQSTMIDEARLAARIHHPNVVPTLDVVAMEGELLLVMEYVRGESLARLIRAQGQRQQRIPLAITSAITLGALHGLHAAHEATSDRGEPLGIVHRDISPQNILVGVDGMARVIDFGVAKAAGRLQLTDTGIIKGKVAYMAPEQLEGHEVTRTADVYAMAVVLWESLTGFRLFQADADAALVKKVLLGTNEPPSRRAPEVPPELDAIVMRGLSLDPRARFATAREMAEAVMRVAAPAFPTDVGEWCSDIARDALAKRGAILADIESTSDGGEARAPMPSFADLGSASRRVPLPAPPASWRQLDTASADPLSRSGARPGAMPVGSQTEVDSHVGPLSARMGPVSSRLGPPSGRLTPPASRIGPLPPVRPPPVASPGPVSATAALASGGTGRHELSSSGHIDEDIPSTASQQSSVATAAPLPLEIASAFRSRWPVVAGGALGGVLVVVGAVVALSRGTRSSAGSEDNTPTVWTTPSAAPPPSATAPSRPASPPLPALAASAPPLPLPSPPPIAAAPPLPSAAAGTAPATAPEAPVVTPPRPSPSPVRRAPAAPVKLSCDPPYVVDSKGIRQYRPECL